jgi:hypothetical protein
MAVYAVILSDCYLRAGPRACAYTRVPGAVAQEGGQQWLPPRSTSTSSA